MLLLPPVRLRPQKRTVNRLRSILLTMVLRDPKVVMAWRRAVVSASKSRTDESSGLRDKLPSLEKIKPGYNLKDYLFQVHTKQKPNCELFKMFILF